MNQEDQEMPVKSQLEARRDRVSIAAYRFYEMTPEPRTVRIDVEIATRVEQLKERRFTDNEGLAFLPSVLSKFDHDTLCHRVACPINGASFVRAILTDSDHVSVLIIP